MKAPTNILHTGKQSQIIQSSGEAVQLVKWEPAIRTQTAVTNERLLFEEVIEQISFIFADSSIAQQEFAVTCGDIKDSTKTVRGMISLPGCPPVPGVGDQIRQLSKHTFTNETYLMGNSPRK